MIKTIKLSKTYKMGKLEVEALKDVNIEVERGEIVSILGPSGCGKSTLLNCLSGIDKCTSGNIFIDNNDITKLSDDKLTRFRAENMGFVFQAYNLIPVLNAVENVELPLLVLGINEKEARERAITSLSLVGLKGKEFKIPATLSGGECQRVSIARALISNPKIVWADEPTGSLDTKTGFEIMELIRKLNEENNQTFVVVTHDIRITKYSNRIIEIDSGMVVSERKV